MKLRESLDGPWMVNNGYTLELATEAVASGRADLVAFGRAYVAHVRPPHGMAYYA